MARSRVSLQQQKTLSLFDEADFAEDRVKPEGKQGGPRDIPAQTEETTPDRVGYDLLERVVEASNMRLALKRVEQNKGAAGVDAMTVKELRPFLVSQWSFLKASLLTGTYRSLPVKRVEISKPTGGVRLLGIPTALDRLIQQAVLQVFTPLFDPHFSPHSYGFRPGKRGHDAVRKAQEYVRAGSDWVVDIDVEKFFDRVNHDILLSRVARKVSDKHVLS
jgi:RNA-directed DNA polymerase